MSVAATVSEDKRESFSAQIVQWRFVQLSTVPWAKLRVNGWRAQGPCIELIRRKHRST